MFTPHEIHRSKVVYITGVREWIKREARRSGRKASIENPSALKRKYLTNEKLCCKIDNLILKGELRNVYDRRRETILRDSKAKGKIR